MKNVEEKQIQTSKVRLNMNSLLAASAASLFSAQWNLPPIGPEIERLWQTRKAVPAALWLNSLLSDVSRVSVLILEPVLTAGSKWAPYRSFAFFFYMIETRVNMPQRREAGEMVKKKSTSKNVTLKKVIVLVRKQKAAPPSSNLRRWVPLPGFIWINLSSEIK